MSATIPAASELSLLKLMTGYVMPSGISLRLYTNNKTPADGDVLADYTEMTGLNYAAFILSPAAWSFSTISSRAVAQYAAQQWYFVNGPAVSVYGYFLTDDTSGLLLAAERFATTRIVQNVGDTLTVTPILRLRQE